jgi:hypothetical protein
MVNDSEYTTIQLSRKLKSFLESKAEKKAETYEMIIWRLLLGQPFTEKEVRQIKAKWEVKI